MSRDLKPLNESLKTRFPACDEINVSVHLPLARASSPIFIVLLERVVDRQRGSGDPCLLAQVANALRHSLSKICFACLLRRRAKRLGATQLSAFGTRRYRKGRVK